MHPFKWITPAMFVALTWVSSQAKAPNIILIMADDLGYGDISSYGSNVVHTPNIDALATGGLKFTDFHSNGAVCSPTRAALMTGQYQQRWGIDEVIKAEGDRKGGLRLEAFTIAEVMKSAGYQTAMFGKWHLGYLPTFNPVHQGFDQFRGIVSGNVDYYTHVDQSGIKDWWKDDVPAPETGYATYLLTNHALDFLDSAKDAPFFLYLPYTTVHYPIEAPKEDNVANGSKAAYYKMIEAMDRGIGEIMAKLKALGLEENTLVFFCSDNGPVPSNGGSAGPYRGQKGNILEGGHRVPAIAYWPGKISVGTTTAQTALTMDLYPTFAAMVGKSYTGLDGVDLSPVLFSGETLPERTTFWAYNSGTAVRKGNWKLDVISGAATLYDLSKDPHEDNNVAAANAAVKADLSAKLTAWKTESQNSVAVEPVSTAMHYLHVRKVAGPSLPSDDASRLFWEEIPGSKAWRDALGKTFPN